MGDMIVRDLESRFVHYKIAPRASHDRRSKLKQTEIDRDSNSNLIRGARAAHVCAIFAFRSWESKCEVRFDENVN